MIIQRLARCLLCDEIFPAEDPQPVPNPSIQDYLKHCWADRLAITESRRLHHECADGRVGLSVFAGYQEQQPEPSSKSFYLSPNSGEYIHDS